MKGYVEIYTRNENETKLIFEADNIIVDGARERIVDILTFKPPTSGITGRDVLASAVTFTIAAMTLGPSRFDLDKSIETGAQFKVSVSGDANKFPVIPKPSDTTLQPVDASNSFGHHLNYWEFNDKVNGLNQLDWSTAASGVTAFYGSYVSGVASSPDLANSKSLIDKDGFIYLNPEKIGVYNPSIDDSASGLITSSTGNAYGPVDQTIEYIFSLHRDDFEQLWEKYGGIDALGLWVWDRDNALAVRGNPPWYTKGQAATGGSGGKHTTSLYNFEATTNFPKFKLFAKRVVFPDGLQINQDVSFEWLTIRWRIKF